MKNPRPITSSGPGDGYQPVRFLQPLLLGAFENAAPGFFDLLQEQVRYNGANPAVTYDMDPLPADGPHIEGVDGTIYLRESFLSYLWGVSYAGLVIYDETIVRPRITPEYVRSAEQQKLITGAVGVFKYALSLTRRYSHWPLEQLPNPERYSEQETFYVEKTDAVFVMATVFVLIHEYAHFFLGHLESDAAGIVQTSTERKADETAADRFAIQTMLEGAAIADPQTANTIRCGIVVGLGAILLPHQNLDGGDEHPDPHLRLNAGIQLLELTADDNLWGIGAMMLALWAMANDKPPIGGYDYDSLQQLLTISLDQLSDPRYQL